MVSKKLVKHIALRAIVIYLTVVVAVYLTIIVANMGGKIDEFVLGDLYTSIYEQINRDPRYRSLPGPEKDKLVKQMFELEVKRLGYDRPFLERSFIYLKNALTLDLGRALFMTSDSGSRLVKNIILERLPNTVMLFTTVTVINFFIHLFLGLYLSRHYGSFFDKLVVALSPTSTLPGWFYGIFLILIFYTWLHVLPPGGMVDVPPPPDPISYALSVLKHMILPMASWIISGFFLGVYGTRTFFLIFSTEDYVEAAKAKGLPPRLIETRYILRPSLPPIVTNFALSLIGSWGGAIITETVFEWPGLGLVTWRAIQSFDTPVLVGITVIYAYLLAATVLILDFVYALIDPRIKAGIA
ncbi:ABC transporter permease [Thermofilum pendens]|uniref:Binding-protein-dependent transport systems inner membrane component n=1 Tax=Thermofilum pendens (strain DSM 2475 / Hrk 5) TaxID=368408 RepID=A1RWH8_THEPD|nr:ABC transporter permease [Thermofilum pendens]ABL77558.1 binding-protein-dependent transport systems inner membrane component [Thermofilum pendens Hrk 5]